EGRNEEGRATHPPAVPLLVERGVELVPSGAEKRAGPLLRRRVWVREHVERRDADQSGTVSAGDSLPGGDRDTEAGERPGAHGDRNTVDRRERRPGHEERTLDRGEELVALPPLRMPGLLGDDIAAVEERDGRPVGRRVKR